MGVDATHRKPKVPVVVIVGMGPKGLYCFESLIAEFRSHPLPSGLEVAIFNKGGQFGASPVYDTGQPSYLLSNVRVKELDLWDVSDPTKPDGPGFIRWYNTQYLPSEPVDPETYPPRAVVGRYLVHGFQGIMSRLPRGVRVSTLNAEVTDIVPAAGGYHVKYRDSAGVRHAIVADKVMLSTGHTATLPARRERYYQDFADRHPGTVFVPHAYPVEERMSVIPAGACVAMKGVGLTFIDAVLALTEGRGGYFKRMANGRLAYRMSGREPKSIIPFCRTGLPIVPKPWDYPSTFRPLTYVTAARLKALRKRARGGKLDLVENIWPLVELDMELRYYRTAMRDPGDRRALEECGDNARSMRQVIGAFLAAHPEVEPFDYRRILDPTSGRRFETGMQYHRFIERYLRREIEHARHGLASSPARAAVSMWFEIRATLKPFVAYGGLTSRSHRLLIEHLFPLFKRVVFGPPLVNIEKVLALHTAGLLDFSVARNPQVATDHASGCFELTTSSPASASAHAEILVDARYPTIEISRDESPLYQRLRDRGMIREFTNISTSATYATGAIDMSREHHHVIDQNGEVNSDIAVCGAPTEGNLIGNFVISRDGYAAVWARNTLAQLREDG
ncbi:FAD/NAD(P)-binding protein [Actinophytocola sp.]|uniref:FAD/NAD(P)-binding protein n=1 Tax=Actinophytocola sp. TaxID=1872138 RepID=UPI002ED3DC16